MPQLAGVAVLVPVVIAWEGRVAPAGAQHTLLWVDYQRSCSATRSSSSYSTLLWRGSTLGGTAGWGRAARTRAAWTG